MERFQVSLKIFRDIFFQWYKGINGVICNIWSFNFAEVEAKWGQGHWHEHDLPSWKDELKSEWNQFKSNYKQCQTNGSENSANTDIEVQITDLSNYSTTWWKLMSHQRKLHICTEINLIFKDLVIYKCVVTLWIYHTPPALPALDYKLSIHKCRILWKKPLKNTRIR